MLRTRLAAEYARGGFRLGGELLDARAYDLAPRSSADGNLVDAFEPLTAYVGWDGAVPGDQTLSLRFGRLAPTLGAGRLLGRNGYRNTPNAFTGAMATLTRGERRLELFALSPQQRLPNDFEAVRDNEWDLDEEHAGVRVLGAYLTQHSRAGDQLEAYGFVLRERDDGLATRNRRLQTLGGRWLRAPAPGAWDGELEAAAQWGEVRATAAAEDGAVLDARAQFFHAALGVTGEGPWAPRVAALLDYASGDDDPTDNRWGRFDALLGPCAAIWVPPACSPTCFGEIFDPRRSAWSLSRARLSRRRPPCAACGSIQPRTLKSALASEIPPGIAGTTWAGSSMHASFGARRLAGPWTGALRC